MKKRWLLYSLIGLAFGLIDWYYLDLLAHFPWGSLGQSPLVIPIIIAMNYGIWLVPVVPIALTKWVICPSVSRHISGPVVMRWIAGFAGLENCCSSR